MNQLELVESFAWPQMEPAPRLAAYFDHFSIRDALSSFEKLADKLESGPQSQPDWSRSPSPGSCSVTSGDYSSSGSSSPSSSLSGAGSPCSARGCGKRKSGNAVAAERYRRKLKGRICGLLEQVELEERRNASLRREFEAKLTIYSEFAELLSRNVQQNDRELAESGLRSLASVLPVSGSRRQLASLRRKFERILAAGARTSAGPETPETPPEQAGQLEYDFYLDSFTERRS